MWRFDQVFLSSKECLEVIVMAVCIYPKCILDEIIAMYLVYMLCIEFNLHLWLCRNTM